MFTGEAAQRWPREGCFARSRRILVSSRLQNLFIHEAAMRTAAVEMMGSLATLATQQKGPKR
jgi:hypothetical protein